MPSDLIAAVFKELKDSDVYKDYYLVPTDTDVKWADEEVNPNGAALRRFHGLQRNLKLAVRLTSSLPDAALKDADQIFMLIDRVLTVLLASEELITKALFNKFFPQCAGMVEGFIKAIKSEYIYRSSDMRTIQTECKNKAFMRQFKQILKEGKCRPVTLIKVLSSFNTHLAINAEKTGRLCDGMMKGSLSVIQKLMLKERLRSHNCKSEIKAVAKWGLV